MQTEKKIIIYPTYSKISAKILNINQIIDVTNADTKSIFVLDSNGKSVPFHYNEMDQTDILNLNENNKNVNLIVTKDNQTYSGVLYKYDPNSITLFVGKDLVKINKYDTIKTKMNKINNSSTISFENIDTENYMLPFQIEYITHKIYWDCEGIGMIKTLTDKKLCETCFNTSINFILKAHIKNEGSEDKYDTYLGYTNYEPRYNYEIYQNNFMSKSMNERSSGFKNQIQNDEIENDYYVEHIGIRKLKQKLNIFEIKTFEVNSMKVYFHFIGTKETHIGYIIEKIENFPASHIRFYEYNHDGIGKIYGEVDIPRIIKGEKIRTIFNTKSSSVVTSSVVQAKTRDENNYAIAKQTIKINCKNKNENDIILSLSFNLANPIDKVEQSIKFKPEIKNYGLENFVSLKFGFVVPSGKERNQFLVISYEN